MQTEANDTILLALLHIMGIGIYVVNHLEQVFIENYSFNSWVINLIAWYLIIVSEV